jgi:hypothetical protein
MSHRLLVLVTVRTVQLAGSRIVACRLSVDMRALSLRPIRSIPFPFSRMRAAMEIARLYSIYIISCVSVTIAAPSSSSLRRAVSDRVSLCLCLSLV